MKRVLRYVAAAFLLLFVLSANLLVRSVLVSDYFSLTHRTSVSALRRQKETTWRLTTDRAWYRLQRYTRLTGSSYATGISWHHRVGLPKYPLNTGRQGPSLKLDWTPNTQILTMPLWPVVLLLGVVPAGYRFKTRRDARRRVALNLCRKCDYDLRASQHRCPECGSPIITKRLEPEQSTGDTPPPDSLDTPLETP